MKESLVGANLQQQLEPLCALKTIAETSGKKDQLTLNNMVFLAQRLFELTSLYNDFRPFGKLGVMSRKLGWEYTQLSNLWEELPKNEESEIVRHSKEIAMKFKHLSYDEIELIACYTFDKELLDIKEQSVAEETLKKLS